MQPEPTIQRFSFEPAFIPDLGPVQYIPSTLSSPVETTETERQTIINYFSEVDYLCPISEPSGIQTFEGEQGGDRWRITVAGDLTNLQPPEPPTDEEIADSSRHPEGLPESTDTRICPGVTVAIACRSADIESPTFFYYNKAEWDHLSQSVPVIDLLWLEFSAGYFLVGNWRQLFWNREVPAADEIVDAKLTLTGNGEVMAVYENGDVQAAHIHALDNVPASEAFGTRAVPSVNVYATIAEMVASGKLDMDQMSDRIFDGVQKLFSCESNHTSSPIAFSIDPDELTSLAT